MIKNNSSGIRIQSVKRSCFPIPPFPLHRGHCALSDVPSLGVSACVYTRVVCMHVMGTYTRTLIFLTGNTYTHLF